MLSMVVGDAKCIMKKWWWWWWLEEVIAVQKGCEVWLKLGVEGFVQERALLMRKSKLGKNR